MIVFLAAECVTGIFRVGLLESTVEAVIRPSGRLRQRVAISLEDRPLCEQHQIPLNVFLGDGVILV